MNYLKDLIKLNFLKSSKLPDFPIWNIIADGKDYQSNKNTDFYDKFNELVQIKKIKKHVIEMYNK